MFTAMLFDMNFVNDNICKKIMFYSCMGEKAIL